MSAGFQLQVLSQEIASRTTVFCDRKKCKCCYGAKWFCKNKFFSLRNCVYAKQTKKIFEVVIVLFLSWAVPSVICCSFISESQLFIWRPSRIREPAVTCCWARCQRRVRALPRRTRASSRRRSRCTRRRAPRRPPSSRRSWPSAQRSWLAGWENWGWGGVTLKYKKTIFTRVWVVWQESESFIVIAKFFSFLKRNIVLFFLSLDLNSFRKLCFVFIKHEITKLSEVVCFWKTVLSFLTNYSSFK